MIVKGTGFDFALMYLAARQPEHDAGAADRVPRAGDPAAHVDDRGRRRDRDHRRRQLRDAGLDRPAAARRARRHRLRGAGGDQRRRTSSRRPGKTENEFVAYTITLQSTLQTPEAFGALPLKSRGRRGGAPARRGARRARLRGAATRSSPSTASPAPSSASSRRPAANPLDTAAAVVDELPAINATLPQGMEIELVYDSTETISASIEEVFKTIAEAVAIVVLVILLFLGSFRSVLMPIVTIPLSLIGVCALLLALGYSINLLSLLAMVLAIGLVVDDAIVVVENIHRHIEEGLTPMDAAILGMKEITGPVVAMTLTLAAVLVAARLHRRADRRAVPRVRLHARRRGDHLRHRRADDHPDDGGAAAEGRRAGPLPAHRRPQLRPGRQLVRAAGVELARLPPGDAADGGRAGRRHRLHVHSTPRPSSRRRRTRARSSPS